jgi:hypothetical protein
MSNFSAVSWREYITLDEMMMMSALYKTNTFSWIFIVLAPLRHIIPIQNQPVLAQWKRNEYQFYSLGRPYLT